MTRGARYLIVLACVGCGLDLTTPDASSFDASTADAPIDFGDGFSFGDGALPEAALLDVYVTLDDGGGLFLCDNDACDGRTHFCDNSSVGPDLGYALCVPLPDGCVPANCECLPNANLGNGCSCEHATTGDGLVAGCSLP